MQIRIERQVDRIEYVQRLTIFQLIEKALAEPILGAVVAGIYFYGRLEFAPAVLQQPDMQEDKAKVVVGFVQLRIYFQRLLEIPDGIAVGKMIEGGPADR